MNKATWTKIALFILMFSVGQVFAASNGFYIGAQAGQTYMHFNNTKAGLTSSTSIDDKGLAGRAYFGYQFDQNWALEIAYAHFHKTTFDNVNGSGNQGSIKANGIDVTWKAILPLKAGFRAFAKIGLARIKAKVNDVMQSNSSNFTADQHKNTWLWGAGVAYDVNQKVSLGASWTRWQNRAPLPHTDLFAADLEYHFG